MYQNENDNLATGYMIGRDSGNGNNGGFGNGDWGWIILLLLFGYGGFGYGGFGGFGRGFGGFGGGGCCNPCATVQDVASGFNNSAVLSNLNDIILGQAGIQQTLCQGFNGVNTSILTSTNQVNQGICNLGFNLQNGLNGISREISDCCCKTQRGIDAVNYNMATNTCALQNTINNTTRDIIDNQNANYRAIHEELVANRIEAKNERIAELTAKVNALQLEASQQAQNAFITANQEAQTAELLRRLGRAEPVASFLVPNPNCCYNPCGNCNNNCCGNNNNGF